MKIMTGVRNNILILALPLLFSGFVSFPPDTGAQVIVGGIIVGQAPPDDCAPDAKGEEMLQAAKNMTNAACTTSAIAAGDRFGFFSETAVAQLDSACTRSQNMVNASGRAADFARSGRKASASCYIVERDDDNVGNDDGICTPDEKYSKKDDSFGCLEDDTDGVGDDDTYCELVQQGHGKKVWEKCLEVCDTPEENPTVTDCTTMDHMTGSLQDAADALETANVQVAAGLQTFEALQARAAQADDNGDGNGGSTCLTASDAVFENRSFPDGSRANQFTELRDALIAAKGIEAAANICTDSADTTFFGADWLAVCVVAHAGQFASSIVADSWEMLDDAITGTRIDNISLCVQDMGSQLNAMQDQLNAMDQKLDTIMDYLNMPPGRRPYFPLKPE